MLKKITLIAVALSLTLSASLATAKTSLPLFRVKPCEEVQCGTDVCDPCDEVTCDDYSCEKRYPLFPLLSIQVNGREVFGSRIETGGWYEMGQYINSHGSRDNGPMHTAHLRRTDFNMDQLYLFWNKELDDKKMQRTFDWGFRTDLVYGAGGPGMQSAESFDMNWGVNRHGYGMSCYQLFGTFGYKDFRIKAGKFITPIGWEAAAAKDNFFFSHSYCYWLEPSTQTGVVMDYDLTDQLTLSAGWTAGHDAGFGNRFNDSALLLGVTLTLTDKSSLYYWMNNGTNKWDGSTKYFVQSLCYEWTPTKKFTYIFQYNLRNDTTDDGKGMGFGFNNHFLYQLTDKLGVGFRAEFVKDNGEYFAESGTDYAQFTWGLRWDPDKTWSFRPEIRYDTARGSAAPFGDGKKSQISGGLGIVHLF